MEAGGSPGGDAAQPPGNGSPRPHVGDLTRILIIKSNPDLSKDSKRVGPLAIYKMCMENDRNTKKWHFRNEDPKKPNKVIMMIGETGSGKTTLINAFINYVFGVQFRYDCRIQLIGEDPVMTQDPHQKSRVMVYQINHQAEFCIPHSLTIIDTPGLPETRGVTPQRTAVQKIRELFYNSELDHIDAICFVTPPSMTSLSLTQKFVFDSLLAMFGPKVDENIVTFMTCAEDDQSPPALAAKVPCAKDKNGCPIHFKFKNGVLYANNSPDANDSNAANEQQWISEMENINTFFKYLSGTSGKNIALQKNILMQSNAYEIMVEALVHRIEEAMSKQYELEQTEKILRRHQVEIEKDEYFEFEVSKPIKEKIDTKGNCTNCHECNSTCHHDCLVAYDTFVFLCEVFYFNASCRVCGHGSSKHFSEKFLWKNLVANSKVTYRSIKMKYKRDDQEVLTYQMVLERIKSEMEQLGEQGCQFILRATDQIKKFTSIRSSEEFVDLLIECENHTRKCGYQGRIEMLKNTKIHIGRH